VGIWPLYIHIRTSLLCRSLINSWRCHSAVGSKVFCRIQDSLIATTAIIPTTTDAQTKTETAPDSGDPRGHTKAVGEKMDRGTYRAIGQTGDTESTSRLDHTVDKGLKEAGTGRTARDRPRD
jgi:hypothetical protein